MKFLQLSFSQLGLFTATCLLTLASLSACVKTSSPGPDFDPHSLLPTMTGPASGSGSTSAAGKNGTLGAAAPSSGAATACPPSLKTDYNAAMNECMSHPTGASCMDLQKQFLNKYPNANCSFKDDDGNLNMIKVANGRIDVSVSGGDSAPSDSENAPASPTPVTVTPAPTAPSQSPCTANQLLEYRIVSSCSHLRVDGEYGSTLSDFSACKTSLSNHLQEDASFVCLVLPGQSETSNIETFGTHDMQSELDHVSDEYDQLTAELTPAPVSTPPQDDSSLNDDSGDDHGYDNSYDNGDPLPVCSTKVIARFALYKKNTAICRVSDAKLAAHRKACLGLAAAMLKAEPQVDCQVSARGAQGFTGGTELRTSAVQDDQSDFQ